MAEPKIQIVIWNDKGQMFYPHDFKSWQDPGNPFEVHFESRYIYRGRITHWGWVSDDGGQRREPLDDVVAVGWFGNGELTLVSSIRLA